jgi:hypothetical protein
MYTRSSCSDKQCVLKPEAAKIVEDLLTASGFVKRENGKYDYSALSMFVDPSQRCKPRPETGVIKKILRQIEDPDLEPKPFTLSLFKKMIRSLEEHQKIPEEDKSFIEDYIDWDYQATLNEKKYLASVANQFSYLDYSDQETIFRTSLLRSQATAFSIVAPCDFTQQWISFRLRCLATKGQGEPFRSCPVKVLDYETEESMEDFFTQIGQYLKEDKGRYGLAQILEILCSKESNKPTIITAYGFESENLCAQNLIVKKFWKPLVAKISKESVNCRIILLIVDQSSNGQLPEDESLRLFPLSDLVINDDDTNRWLDLIQNSKGIWSKERSSQSYVTQVQDSLKTKDLDCANPKELVRGLYKKFPGCNDFSRLQQKYRYGAEVS